MSQRWVMCLAVNTEIISKKDCFKVIHGDHAKRTTERGTLRDSVELFMSGWKWTNDSLGTVSYTHLTLPTIYSV